MKLIISFILVFLTGFLGSSSTMSQIDSWYSTIQKAPFNPPNWVFGPAWTILYILMAISLSIVWRKTKFPMIFLIQLSLNFLWSYIFFGLHLPLLAFIDIILLWIFILLTIIKFTVIDKTAAYLLYPYLGWVSFASILNLFVVLLN